MQINVQKYVVCQCDHVGYYGYTSLSKNFDPKKDLSYDLCPHQNLQAWLLTDILSGSKYTCVAHACAKTIYICHCAFSWSELRHTQKCSRSRLCLTFYLRRCFSRIWRFHDSGFIRDQSYASTDAAVVVARWSKRWRSECRNYEECDYNYVKAHWGIQVKIPNLNCRALHGI